MDWGNFDLAQNHQEILHMLMIGRVQDLLWEIRKGRKVTADDYPKGIISVISTVLDWGAFPVLWFALY